MVDLVHRRVVLCELGVKPVPGLEELRDGGVEEGLAGERQHGLVDQDVEMTQHNPSGGDYAVPEPAQIRVS